MPLIKRNAESQIAGISSPIEPSVTSVPVVATKVRMTKISECGPITKEAYWERKEVRDIRTGECIRLSGVLQALLSSVNYGQYCTIADKDAYLAQVKKDAKELAKFITEEA